MDNIVAPPASSTKIRDVKEGDLLTEDCRKLTEESRNRGTLVKSGPLDISRGPVFWSGYPKELREQNVAALVKMKMHLELIRTAMARRLQENSPEEAVEQIKKNLTMLKEAFRYQVQIQNKIRQQGNKYAGSYGNGPSDRDSPDDLLLVSPPSLRKVASELSDFVRQLEEQSTASETAGVIASKTFDELAVAPKELICASSSRSDDVAATISCDEEVAKMTASKSICEGEVCETTAGEEKGKIVRFSVLKKHKRKRNQSSKTRREKLHGDNESENSLIQPEMFVASHDPDLATFGIRVWTDIVHVTENFRNFLLCNDSRANQGI